MKNLDLNKLIVPVAIVIGSLIIGGFYYATQINRQVSIERQQRLEFEEAKIKQLAEDEIKQKEYLAQRKSDCLDIYNTEGAKWENVTGWRFDESNEGCYIRYKENIPKSNAECDEFFNTEGEFGYLSIISNLLCKEGQFENMF
jgi:hypothetical protein